MRPATSPAITKQGRDAACEIPRPIVVWVLITRILDRELAGASRIRPDTDLA